MSPALLPELKAAFRVKSCVVNGTTMEESQPSLDVTPKPKPRVCPMDTSAANRFTRRHSTGDDRRRALKPETGKLKPVPAPRKNVPKVRQRQVSVSASNVEGSVEGMSIANTDVKSSKCTANINNSPWEDEEPDIMCKEKTRSLKS